MGGASRPAVNAPGCVKTQKYKDKRTRRDRKGNRSNTSLKRYSVRHALGPHDGAPAAVLQLEQAILHAAPRVQLRRHGALRPVLHDADPHVAPAGLGCVQALVGQGHHIFPARARRVVGGEGIAGKADRTGLAQRDAVAQVEVAGGHAGAHPFGQQVHLGVRGLLGHDQKFFSAPAHQGEALPPQSHNQPVRHMYPDNMKHPFHRNLHNY